MQNEDDNPNITCLIQFYYPRPVLAFGYCRCLRLSVYVSVRPSVCVCGKHLLVRAITHHPFKLRSPNLDHMCKRPWLRSILFSGVIDSSIGRPFRSPLRRRKMAALPLPAAILDDLIFRTGNEVIQDGGRKRKGRHFPPPPQWGSKRPPQVLVDVISSAAILESRWWRHK